MKTVLVTDISHPNLYHHNGLVRKTIQENDKVYWFTHQSLVGQVKYIYHDCFDGRLEVKVLDDHGAEKQLQIAIEVFTVESCDTLRVYGHGREDAGDHQHHYSGPKLDKLRQVWVFENTVMPHDRGLHCVVDGCDPKTEYRKIPFNLNLTGRCEDWFYVFDKTQKVYTREGSLLHHISRHYPFGEKVVVC